MRQPKWNPLTKDKPTAWFDEEFLFEVDGNDIRWGVPGSQTGCAFARAAKRCGPLNAWIGRHSSYLEFEDVVYRFRTPPSMRTETEVFDRGGRFEAGVYALKPVPVSARQRSDKGKVRGSGKGRPGHVHYTGQVRRG